MPLRRGLRGISVPFYGKFHVKKHHSITKSFHEQTFISLSFLGALKNDFGKIHRGLISSINTSKEPHQLSIDGVYDKMIPAPFGARDHFVHNLPHSQLTEAAVRFYKIVSPFRPVRTTVVKSPSAD